MADHIIIVEIDENAHINYDSSCENKRLMELSQDLGFRPIVFIRFNPDDYIDKEGNNGEISFLKYSISAIPAGFHILRLVSFINN